MKTCSRLLLALSLVFCVAIAHAQTVILDNFEAGSLRVSDPTAPLTLFSQYEGEGDIGTEAAATAAAHDGTYGLRINITSSARGGIYMQQHTHNGGSWLYSRQWLISGQTWPAFNTINRMRFWVRPPSSVSTSVTADKHNVEMGTYVRASTDPTDQQGRHFYHFYQIPYCGGSWHKVILDYFPQHEVGENPNTETNAPQLNPNEGGRNYFDSLTRWYFDMTDPDPGSVNGIWDFDQFEYYADTNPENIADIASLSGCYNPAATKTFVAWQRKRSVPSQQFDVRYKFSSMNIGGFTSGTVAPGSPITSGPDDVYMGVQYSTTSIVVGTNPTLFIAMRPVGATLFREISLPTGQAGGGGGTAPSAPTNLQVH